MKTSSLRDNNSGIHTLDQLIFSYRNGFSYERASGMDGHSCTAIGKMGCLKAMWSDYAVRGSCCLSISEDILNLIPCPFLVVGGAWPGIPTKQVL